jgi:hypothetical protein
MGAVKNWWWRFLPPAAGLLRQSRYRPRQPRIAVPIASNATSKPPAAVVTSGTALWFMTE